MAARKLAAELKGFEKEPLEGVSIDLANDSLFAWNVGIFGPPNTLYAGGYFRAEIKFPETYPFEPPAMRFLDPMYHPNVYEDGRLCISILHPPGEDEQSGELPEERWNPTQQVRTILLSVISLLNEPNISSPANVTASVDYRKWREGQDGKYERVVKQQVEKSRAYAKAQDIYVPTTVEEYCIQHRPEDPEPFDWTMDDDDDEGADWLEGSGDESDSEFVEEDDEE